MSTSVKTIILLVICIISASAVKVNLGTEINTSQSETTYSFSCPSGTILKARHDFTDQQVEGTNFAGFTCCPSTHPDLHYLNENYFCCPTGTGAYCMSNACNCKSAALKGGQRPTIVKK